MLELCYFKLCLFNVFAAYQMKATTKAVEAIWIFEKEARKFNDDTPQWEGVIVEYLHKVRVRPIL